MKLSDEQQAAIGAGLKGKTQVVLVPGFAGTGKSEMTRALIEQATNPLIISYSGISAINIGGETAAAAFGVPCVEGVLDPTKRDTRNTRSKDPAQKHWNRKNPKAAQDDPHRWEPIKATPIRIAGILVIDECYRLRCDQIDFIDKECRKSRKCPHLPFGGLRVFMVGDEGQGMPIVKKQELKGMEKYGYEYPYDFRTSKVFADITMEVKPLTKIFRQDDSRDGLVLSRFRTGTQTAEDIAYVNTLVAEVPPARATILAPTHEIVNMRNQIALNRCGGEPITLVAKKKGTFKKKSETSLPYPTELTLKPGCRIIVKKNVKTKVQGYTQQVFNGDQGVYIGMDKHKRLVIDLDRGEQVYLGKVKQAAGITTEKRKVCLNPEEPEEQHEFEEREVITPNKANLFEQYPIRLGYAITIAASQGSTMPKVHIDFGRGIFGMGDFYTALSRVKGGFRNLTISRPITPKDNLVSHLLQEGKGEQWELAI